MVKEQRYFLCIICNRNTNENNQNFQLVTFDYINNKDVLNCELKVIIMKSIWHH